MISTNVQFLAVTVQPHASVISTVNGASTYSMSSIVCLYKAMLEDQNRKCQCTSAE